MRRNRPIILIGGAILALLLVLFPQWNAVDPTTTLVTPLGRAWITSPPPPPKGYKTLRVERSSLDYILPLLVLVAAGALYWAEGRIRKDR